MTCLTEICVSVVLLAMVSISTSAPYNKPRNIITHKGLSEVISKTRKDPQNYEAYAGYGYRKIENRHVGRSYEDRTSDNGNFYNGYYPYVYTTYGTKLSRKTLTYDPTVYENRYTTYGGVTDNRSGFPLIGNSQDRFETPAVILDDRVYPTHYSSRMHKQSPLGETRAGSYPYRYGAWYYPMSAEDTERDIYLSSLENTENRNAADFSNNAINPIVYRYVA